MMKSLKGQEFDEMEGKIISNRRKYFEYLDGWYREEHNKEGSFRWMSKKASIFIPDSQKKKHKYLHLFVQSEYTDFSQILTVEYQGEKISKIPLIHRWNDYSICLPHSARHQRKKTKGKKGLNKLVLTLNKIIPESFRPGDGRNLGFKVKDIYLHNNDSYHRKFLFFYKNAYLNYQDMLEGKKKLDSYPIYLGIDIYGKCNIKPPCVYCEWDIMKKSEGKFANAVVDDKTLKGYGPFYEAARNLVNCSIGEPLIHPRLNQILEMFDRDKKLFEMATNAQNLTMGVIRTLIGKRIDLYVSLDAACKETYAKIRNDKWDDIIPQLILLNRERKKSGNLPRIFMIFMPMRVNKNDLEDFFRLCQKIDADHLILRPLNFLYDMKFEIERGGYRFNYERELLSREELETIFKKCDEYSRLYNVPVGNQFDFGKGDNGKRE